MFILERYSFVHFSHHISSQVDLYPVQHWLLSVFMLVKMFLAIGVTLSYFDEYWILFSCFSLMILFVLCLWWMQFHVRKSYTRDVCDCMYSIVCNEWDWSSGQAVWGGWHSATSHGTSHLHGVAPQQASHGCGLGVRGTVPVERPRAWTAWDPEPAQSTNICAAVQCCWNKTGVGRCCTFMFSSVQIETYIMTERKKIILLSRTFYFLWLADRKS